MRHQVYAASRHKIGQKSRINPAFGSEFTALQLKRLLLVRAVAWDSLLIGLNHLLAISFGDLADISAIDKHVPCHELLEEIVFTCLGEDLGLVRLELRLSGNNVVLVTFNLSVEEDTCRGFA